MFQTHTPPTGSHLIAIDKPSGLPVWINKRTAAAMARNDERYAGILELAKFVGAALLCAIDDYGELTVLDAALDRHAHGRATLLDDASKRLGVKRATWVRCYDREIAKRSLFNGFRRAIVADLYYGLTPDSELYAWEPTWVGVGVVRAHAGGRTTIKLSDGTTAVAHESTDLHIGEAVGVWWYPTLDRVKPGVIVARRLSP